VRKASAGHRAESGELGEPAGVEVLVGRLARSIVKGGAQAVALVGSRATGEAAADSDLDLAVVGDGPRYRLEIHEGVLVSLGWATAEEQRRRLYDPAYLAMHVPGWRDAIVLCDPDGVAEEIKEEAIAWRWTLVDERCDHWVAETLTGYAEEVHKLRSGLRRRDRTTAAVQRSVLALHLARIIAIRRRILFGSENRLWELVARDLGAAWSDAQSAALAIGGESLEASSEAAVRLFELAVDEVRPLLDRRQRAVVDHALRK
jgi:predicted nucleotidyltransferase